MVHAKRNYFWEAEFEKKEQYIVFLQSIEDDCWI